MSLICNVKVVPSSGKSECKLDKNGVLKCYLKSHPEKGKANKELIKMIADALSILQKDVTILVGEASRSKSLRIDCEISREQFLEKMGIVQQMNLF